MNIRLFLSSLEFYNTMFVQDALEKIKMGADPRTQDFPLVGNPTTVFSLIFLYVYAVKYAGPRWMEHRKPFPIKPVILTYDAMMVVVNVFLFYNVLSRTYLGGGYSWTCQAGNVHDLSAAPLLNYLWWAYLVRVFDFLDTMFFVLRKKYTHVSFLHVFHHAMAVGNGWFFLTFGACGQPIMGLCINTFIHIIMYSYYFLSALGPAVQKYLWWKRYITIMQIGQFIVFIPFMCIPLIKDCGYPNSFVVIAAAQAFLFLMLFINFYAKTYTSAKKELFQMFAKIDEKKFESEFTQRKLINDTSSLSNGITRRQQQHAPTE